MTPPTQQVLEALREAAAAADQNGQHVYTNPRNSNNWRANEAWHCVASPATVIDMIDLIAARDKEIAELKAQVGLAHEIGFRDTDVTM